MIIVRITSGLGNQMYQYNFYRFLKSYYKNTVVKADITWFNAFDEHHGYELERIFGHNPGFEIDIASKKEIYNVTGQIPPLIKGPLARTMVFLLGPVNRILREHAKTDKSIYRIEQLEDDTANQKVLSLDTQKDWYLSGFWIEECFVKDRVDQLRGELIFPDFNDEANKELQQKIAASNSVSIHVRRGDYLSDLYASKFKVLGREYYEKAVEIMRSKVDNPIFFIFSDDADFVAEEFEWLDEKVIVNINSGNDSYKDMQLMSLCKHNIIANSTFSQWGSLLNVHGEHITIYPNVYMADEDTEIKSIPGWIRV